MSKMMMMINLMMTWRVSGKTARVRERVLPQQDVGNWSSAVEHLLDQDLSRTGSFVTPTLAPWQPAPWQPVTSSLSAAAAGSLYQRRCLRIVSGTRWLVSSYR